MPPPSSWGPGAPAAGTERKPQPDLEVVRRYQGIPTPGPVLSPMLQKKEAAAEDGVPRKRAAPSPRKAPASPTDAVNAAEALAGAPPIKFWCGLVSGAVVAGSFNPIDRALYLAVKNERPFLLLKNFRTPYQGFMNSLLYRCISGGIYFPLEDVFYTALQNQTRRRRATAETTGTAKTRRKKGEHPAQQTDKASGAFTQTDANALVAGMAAGTMSATVLNPIQAVRYHCWGKDDRTVFVAAREMFAAGRLRPFTKGIVATVLRDSLFGGFFTFARKRLSALQLKRSNAGEARAAAATGANPKAKPSQAAAPVAPQPANERSEFAATVVAGMLAAGLSAPMNFVRNMQFSSPPSEPAPSIPRVFYNLGMRCRAVQRSKGTRAALHYATMRMNVGWGTMRVGLGMAVGALLYELLYERAASSEALRSASRAWSPSPSASEGPTAVPALAAPVKSRARPS